MLLAGLVCVAALVAEAAGAPIRQARTLALSESCEAALLRALRNGLVNSERDVLRVARELDAARAAGSIDVDQLGLLGVPVCCLSLDAGVSTTALERSGALVLTQFSAEAASGLVNPRDAEFRLTDGRAEDADRAVAAVAAGRVAAAVLQPRSVPLSVSWTGITALRLPASEEGTVLCGGSVEDVAMLLDSLRPGVYEHPARSKISLQGLRLAYCSQESALFDGPVESCVSVAVEAAVEMLRSLGAECVRLPSLGEELSLPEGCAALLTPHAPSAAVAVSERSHRPLEERRSLGARLRSRALLSLPAGVVAGEDDGYDSSLNELLHSEGLPVNLLVVSAGDSADSVTAVSLIGHRFEQASRWSSELLAAGQSRLEAKADLDDARELFGIFFPSTLLRYVGKRR